MLHKERLINFFSSQSFCPHLSLPCTWKEMSSLERPLFSQASGQLCCLPGIEQHHSNAIWSSIRALGFMLDVKSLAKTIADWTEYYLEGKKRNRPHAQQYFTQEQTSDLLFDCSLFNSKGRRLTFLGTNMLRTTLLKIKAGIKLLTTQESIPFIIQ